jgi:hypothetical protein
MASLDAKVLDALVDEPVLGIDVDANRLVKVIQCAAGLRASPCSLSAR